MLGQRTLALLLLAAACAPDDSLPQFGSRAYVGDNLEIWTTDEATVCGGSFEALDRHAGLLADFADDLGIQTTEQRYTYYWMSRDELVDEGPCPFPGPCAFGRGPRLYAAHYSAHELVHAELAFEHSSFVDEGVADLLGDNYLGAISKDTAIPEILDQTQGERLNPGWYEQAAMFVGALRELYPEQYLAALLTTERSDDFATFERRMADADIDVDAALQLYDSESSCWMDAVRVALSECAVEPIPWDATSGWTATGRLDCADSGTLGPSGGEQPEMWTIRSVDIPRAGRYTVWFDSEPRHFARMVGCEAPWCGTTSSVANNVVPFFANSIAPLELQPGRYWFRVSRPVADGPGGDFTLRIIEGWHDEDPRP